MLYGQRVRVRMSVWTKVTTPPAHWPALEGQSGVVTAWFSLIETKTQAFTVTFDKPVKIGEMPIIRRSFAPVDLVAESEADQPETFT